MEEKEGNNKCSEELGTLGELLLACAVKRHGTHSWESVAQELCTRLSHPFTPHFCQQQYSLLLRRFNNLHLLSLTHQLRILRVQDLHQQLRRHNTSIQRLQEKVKRLREELWGKEEADPRDEEENGSYNKESKEKGGGGGEIRSEEEDIMNTNNRERSSRIMKRRRLCRGDDLLSILLEGGANTKARHIKSQPLIKFLQTLRSHKHASPFFTRLPTQETEKYQSLVREHMDLDMVEYRLQMGNYNDCHSKFYRDLLLIFTNAVIFYRKSCAEHMAARELRKLVLDEIALWRRNETQPCKANPHSIQHLDSVVKKPRSSSCTFSLLACRRRGSLSTQALSDSSMKSHEKDNKDGSTHATANTSSNAVGVVTRSKEKDYNNYNNNDDTKERSLWKQPGLKVSSVDSSRGTSKNSMKGESKYTSIVTEDGNKIDEGSSESDEGNEPLEMKKRKKKMKKKETSVEQKKGMTTRFNKQGVANFLKRINQNSPSTQEKKKAKVTTKKEADDEDEERERRRKMRNDDNISKGTKKMKGGNAKISNLNGDNETKKEKALGKKLTTNKDTVKGGTRCLRSNGGHTSTRPRNRR